MGHMKIRNYVTDSGETPGIFKVSVPSSASGNMFEGRVSLAKNNMQCYLKISFVSFQNSLQFTLQISLSIKMEEKEKTARPQWGNGVEFLMSCVAFSVGLGNVWRFPYTAYENGGGAFLIPYIVVLFVIGKPFYYMEMILGQFTSRSCVQIWSVSPAFQGIGYGVVVSVFSVITYYCALMALTLYYMVASCQSVLPWSYCWEEWGDVCFNSSSSDEQTKNGSRSSADFYFRKYVLNETGIEDGLGIPSWKLIVALLVSWIFVYVVICKGVKSTGKAAYFLALFPYIIMISLLVRAVTLDGAVDGIIFLFKPTWNKILEPSVWYAAVTQSFFSLGVCFGAVTMYSSYNSFEHNVSRYTSISSTVYHFNHRTISRVEKFYEIQAHKEFIRESTKNSCRDCTIVTSLDLCTSLMASATIFGILGNLAHEIGSDDIGSVVRAGTGLAFVSYPEALAKFTVIPQLFAVLFFLMLFVLGIGTTVAFCNVIISIIKDQFPQLNQWKIAAVVAILGFSIGIVYCTPGGQYILNLVDYFGGTFIIVFLASFEMIAISWVYGVDNFMDDVEFMVGRRPFFYWRFCWCYLTPLFLFTILIYFLIDMTPLMYNNEYYPTSAYAVGWTLLALGILPFPLGIIIVGFRNRNKAYSNMFKPSADWGPKDLKKYNEWGDFKRSKRISRACVKKSKVIAALFGKN
ncbi:sodium-dependent nutrient amino acid transporter 1 isoform X2 [Monomorium pharaonis]|uniref:sodium-dependent nutrient amino acid transporter 1 isoform X2 n=1 Tax=Monomorium pharaonis TaxID=307658 RepID=UPI00063FA0EE|nr:sodium-dependent nutrient amino acid transporter 1 isoform X2 [Monomorium pharaonis]